MQLLRETVKHFNIFLHYFTVLELQPARKENHLHPSIQDRINSFKRAGYGIDIPCYFLLFCPQQKQVNYRAQQVNEWKNTIKNYIFAPESHKKWMIVRREWRMAYKHMYERNGGMMEASSRGRRSFHVDQNTKDRQRRKAWFRSRRSSACTRRSGRSWRRKSSFSMFRRDSANLSL